MASAAEQLAANLNFGALAKAEELKKRIWFTLGALIIYRLGTYIPLPGIIRARTKPLEVRARLTTAAPKTRLTKLVDAPARAAGIMVDSVDALVAELQKRGALA